MDPSLFLSSATRPSSQNLSDEAKTPPSTKKPAFLLEVQGWGVHFYTS